MPSTSFPVIAVVAPLNVITLVVVLLLATLAFGYFMRKRQNRHPMDTPAGKKAEEMRRQQAEAKRREDGRPKVD
ncbi:MAG: hypothetical protein GW855_08100 [Erythrobacter sp.]|nr:hypothetical protein [Erythrobacter sp.]NCQ63184.1 hypothetical protein [Alphaproteobacteria bacterium]